MSKAEKPMPVVVFTGGPAIEAQVLRFVSRLEEESGIELLAIVSESPIRGFRGIVVDLWQRRGILAPALFFRYILFAFFTALRNPAAALRRRQTLKNLGGRIHYFDSIHADDALKLVRDLRPELGLVYGGPIIKPELFSIPARGTLGIHHGKVPDYRGKKTTFWAMYNGEPDVAVIIQKIGSKLDAGDIVLQAGVSVRNRPLPLVRKELEIVGIDLYLKAIAAMADGTARYTPQPTGARHLYKDPTFLDILRFWGRYFARLLRGT
jgi:folate-dependent phosphoribosylglycinamide formyltransferase PurN